MTRELREGGVYQFPMDTEVIASASDGGGYVLYTASEWDNASTADREADADGNIYFQGDPTPFTTDDLSDTGQTRKDAP